MKSSRVDRELRKSSSPTPGTNYTAGNDLESGFVQQETTQAKEEESKLDDENDDASSTIVGQAQSALVNTSNSKANESEGQLTPIVIVVEESQESTTGTFALRNTEVLEKIAGHLPVEELFTKRQTCSKKRPRSSSPTPGTSNNAGNNLQSTGLVQEEVPVKEHQSKLNDDATSSPIAKRTRSGLSTTSKFKANEFEGQLTSVAVEESQENKVGTFAMQNTEVLEKIAGHFSVDELVTKRQTYRLWNSSFLPDLKAQHKLIKLTVPSENEDGSERLESLQDFTKQMKSSQEIPYTKVEIKNLFTASDADFEEFFSVFGTSMRSLSVPLSSRFKDNTNNKLTMEDIERLRAIIFELTPELNELTLAIGEYLVSPAEAASENRKPNLTQELPNLQQLTLLRGRKKADGLSELIELQPAYRELLADILANAKNLNTLKLLQHPTSETLDRDILAVVRSSLKSIQTLKKLIIKQLRIPELEMLTELAKQAGNSLQLQEFGISLPWDRKHDHEEQDENDFDNPQDDERLETTLLTFLGTQSSNLKKLKIGLVSHGQVPPNKTLRLPQMPEVHTFSFKIGSPYVPRLPISFTEQRTFENVFPSLTCFKYKYCKKASFRCGCGYSFHNRCTNLQNFSHDGVTELSLNFSYTPYTRISAFLSNFAYNFPSVTKLDLTLSIDSDEEDIMTNVLIFCARWSSLTELHLAFGDVSYGSQYLVNQMLSGVPESKYKDLRQEFLQIQKSKAWTKIPTLREKYKTQIGISDLKQLRKFVLNINFYETYKPENEDQEEDEEENEDENDSVEASDSGAEEEGVSITTAETSESDYSEEEWSDFESTSSSEEDDSDGDFNLDIAGYITIAACGNLQHIEISPGGSDGWNHRVEPIAFIPGENDAWNHFLSRHALEKDLKTKFVSTECLEYIKTSLNQYAFIKL